jgi:YD repeat-containing protein
MKQNKKNIKITILLIFTNIILNLTLVKSQINISEHEETLKNFNIQNNSTIDLGNYNINNLNGNIIYTYPISNYSYNNTNIPVTLNYCGNVNFTSFAAYDKGNGGNPDKWIKLDNQKPLWVLTVDGFVVQTLSKVSTFFNDLDINKNKTISTLPPTDDKINQYNHPKYYDYKNKDVIWLVEGYDYCNSMVDTRVWGQDVIKILKGDGTILELLNSTSAMSNSSPMTNNQDLRYSGRYYENGINTSGYAIVEFYNPHNINSNYGLPDNIRSKNLICYGEYGNITYLPRKVRYFPGNGKEYVFLETLAPYGEDLYNYCFQNYNNNTNKFDLSVFPNFLIDNNINVFPSPNEYSNLNLGFNSNFGAFNPYSNIKYNNNLISGRPIGMPTIFYLTEIHNEHKLITKLKYNSNSLKSIKKENVEIDQLLENEFNTEKEFLDMSIGRGTINSFFNHQIEYSSIFNHFKISTPEKIVIADFIYNENDKLKFSNKNYTLYGKIENIDKNNFIDFDYLPLGNLKQFKPSFINNSSYLLGLKDLYHNSIILYPSIISEFHTKKTDIDDFKKPIVTTNFAYEEYNTNFTFDGNGFMFPRYNFSQSIDYANKSLNLTNKRLTKVLSDNVEYTFSYKDAERQNFINNPCLTCKSQLNSIQKFYSYNNVINSVVENYNQLSLLKKFLFEYSTKIDNDSFEIQYFPLKSSITESHSTNGGSTFLTKSKKIKYFNNLSTHIKARGVKYNNNQYSIYHKELIREDELYYKNDLTNNVWDYRNTTLYDYEFLKNSTGLDISNKFYPTKSISYTLKNQGSVSEFYLTNYNQSDYELTNIDFNNRVLKPFLETTYEPQFSYELKKIKEFNFYNNCFGDFQATNNILANLEVNFTNFKNQTKLNTINNSKINNIIETEYENFGYLNDANIQDKKERRLNLTMSFLNFNNIKKIKVLKNLMTTYNTNNCDFNFNLKNLSFEEGISQTRYYEYFNLNKLFFRPIFGLVKSKIVKKNDNSILNGIENEYYLDNIVNTTTNELSLIRGKLQRSYILGLNATPTLNRKLNYENQYNIGYELGGLVKSTLNTNNAKIVNFYDFNSFDYNFFTSKFCDNLYLEKNNLLPSNFNEYSGTTNLQNFGYYLRNSNSKSSNFIKNIIDSDNLPYKNANNEKTISSKILTNKDNVYYEQINSGVNSYFKNSPNVTLIYKRDNLNNNYTNISNIDYLSYFKEFNIKNEVTSFTNSNGWLNNYKYDTYGRLIRTNNSGDFSNPLSYLTELDKEMNEKIAINESYSYTEDIVGKVSLFTYFNKYDCINGKKIFKEKTGITDLTNNKTYQQFFEDENITLFKFSYPYDCINLIANEEVYETSPLTIYSTLPDNIISINNLNSVALEFNIKRIIDDNNINLEGIKSIKVDVKITNNNSIMMNESYEMSIIKNLINDNNIENNLETDIDKENLDKLLTSYTAKIDLNEFKNNIKNVFNSQDKLLKVEISIADNEHKGLIIHNNSVLKPRIKLTGGFTYNIDYTIKFRDHFIKNDFTQINNFYRIKENNKYKHYLTQHNKVSSHNQLIETIGFEPIEYFSSFNSFLINNSLNDKSIRFKESIISPDIQINSLINRYDILNSNYNNVGNSKTYYDGNSNVLNSVLNSRSNGDFDTKIKNEYDSQNRLIRTYKEKGNNIFDKIEI